MSNYVQFVEEVCKWPHKSPRISPASFLWDNMTVGMFSVNCQFTAKFCKSEEKTTKKNRHFLGEYFIALSCPVNWGHKLALENVALIAALYSLANITVCNYKNNAKAGDLARNRLGSTNQVFPWLPPIKEASQWWEIRYINKSKH